MNTQRSMPQRFQNDREGGAHAQRRSSAIRGLCAAASMLMLMFAGCGEPQPKGEFTDVQFKKPVAPVAPLAPAASPLREGDVVRVTFPGAPNLNGNPQQIRQDGTITLPLIGEVKAAGLTATELQARLVAKYGTQLVSKEVTVTVESSAYTVYVTGAVLKPGKISSNHPLSVLEAVMEAGGFDYTKANLKKVKVVRQEGSATKNYTLDLKAVLDGKQTEPFMLKPSDIVFVPEKFNVF